MSTPATFETSGDTNRPEYFEKYENLAFTRDDDGVLVLRFHTNGGRLVFTGQTHSDFTAALEEMSLDHENKALVITGTGDAFIDQIDGLTLGQIFKPAVWEKIRVEGAKVLQRLLDLPMPVVGVANGPATVHSEYLLLRPEPATMSVIVEPLVREDADLVASENPLAEGLERLPVRPTTLVMFGGTGDLAHRKLLPALYNLAHDGALPERFRLVGVARSDHPHEDFRQMARESIMRFSRREPDPDVLDGLIADIRPSVTTSSR